MARNPVMDHKLAHKIHLPPRPKNKKTQRERILESRVLMVGMTFSFYVLLNRPTKHKAVSVNTTRYLFLFSIILAILHILTTVFKQATLGPNILLFMRKPATCGFSHLSYNIFLFSIFEMRNSDEAWRVHQQKRCDNNKK